MKTTLSIGRHSGMVRSDQTRNLEIPGSMLRSPRNDGYTYPIRKLSNTP